MAKFKIEVREVVYSTYEVTIPEKVMEDLKLQEREIEEYFYQLEDHDRYLVDKDSFSWEIDEITEIGD